AGGRPLPGHVRRPDGCAGGHRCPVVGGVNMDQTVIDVGRLEIELGEPVVVLGGEGPTLVEWAEWAQTLPHEILTGLGGRVARRYSGVSRDQR
ncbi:MAG TPA: alanine racemase C-terminal domain-containing protein, partial [Dermatophilaceae bacterium]|nr:alanine racemase C-terminal domain-containing protein [Dermatophilaceae bacterium]